MIDQELAQSLKAWPFKEALQIIKKNGGLLNFKIPSKGYVLLETGYGPSGLPHIGTFGEVVRTSMVNNAFSSIIDCTIKLITFSLLMIFELGFLLLLIQSFLSCFNLHF